MTVVLATEAPEVSNHETCTVVKVFHNQEHVFTCHAMEPASGEKLGEDRDVEVLEKSFEVFNVGTGLVAQTYRQARLRSLSVGDRVDVGGRLYECASVGWERVE